jgi:hypothetical protein
MGNVRRMTNDTTSQISVDARELLLIADGLNLTVNYLSGRMKRFVNKKVRNFAGEVNRETVHSCLIDLEDLRRRLNELVAPHTPST